MGSVIAAQNKIWWKFNDDHFFVICLDVYAISLQKTFCSDQNPATGDVPVMSKASL